MLTSLYRSAVAWTTIGLLGGLAYREVTKHADFTGFTQLSVVHTHALSLGPLMLFGVLALAVVLNLREDRMLKAFVPVWNVGLALTVGTLAVKGYLQVQHSPSADSSAIAGIAGLGHMTLTAGFVLLLLAVRNGVAALEGRGTQGPRGTTNEVRE